METDKYLIEILNRLASDITDLKASVKDISREQIDQDKKIVILEMCKDKAQKFSHQFKEIAERVEELEYSDENTLKKIKTIIRKISFMLKIIIIIAVVEIMIAYHTQTISPIFEKFKTLIKIIF